MTIGSLFSGIGGIELGLERAGLGPVVWQVEKDPYCRKTLAKHWPQVERFEDVKDVGAATLAPVELICGGFPCQDVSSAGKSVGLTGSRSGLWGEFARIVGELKPRWVVVENVTSGASRWLDPVVRDLAELGYEALPLPLSAEAVGAPHLRRRHFIVARLADSYGVRKPQPEGHHEACGRRASDGGRQVPNTNSERLREQQRRGEQRRGSAQFRYDGAARKVEHASGFGRAPLPASESDGHWLIEPEVGRVAHGIPGRMDRLRALGNAVVPQCAEVAGWVIRELELA